MYIVLTLGSIFPLVSEVIGCQDVARDHHQDSILLERATWSWLFSNIDVFTRRTSEAEMREVKIKDRSAR